MLLSSRIPQALRDSCLASEQQACGHYRLRSRRAKSGARRCFGCLRASCEHHRKPRGVFDAAAEVVPSNLPPKSLREFRKVRRGCRGCVRLLPLHSELPSQGDKTGRRWSRHGANHSMHLSGGDSARQCTHEGSGASLRRRSHPLIGSKIVWREALDGTKKTGEKRVREERSDKDSYPGWLGKR